jgi:flavodoxin
MRVFVIYESLFGNTEQVAKAIATGLSRRGDVQLSEVRNAPPVLTEPVDLIVVGGPTHVFSMTRRSTREDAFKQGAGQGSMEVGVREWLGRQQKGEHDGRVAMFDTRVEKVRHLPGSAARAADRLARRLGYKAATGPESFYVEGVSGPLVEGELERAQAWGERLGSAALKGLSA